MADVPEPIPEVAKSAKTHTPLDHSMEAWAWAQAHGNALRQCPSDAQPPLPPARPAHHFVPHTHNTGSGAEDRARQVQRNIMAGGDDPP